VEPRAVTAPRSLWQPVRASPLLNSDLFHCHVRCAAQVDCRSRPTRPEYARTAAQCRFWLADELAAAGGVFRSESRHQGELAKVRLGDAELWLLKP